MWLLANPTAKVIMFDMFTHSYSDKNEDLLRHRSAKYGLANVDVRLTTVKGSSITNVPKFASEHPDIKCNILSVDGNHDHTYALKDILQMRQLANESMHVLLVDDTNCVRQFCVDDAVRLTEKCGETVALLRLSEHPSESEQGYRRGVTMLQYSKHDELVDHCLKTDPLGLRGNEQFTQVF